MTVTFYSPQLLLRSVAAATSGGLETNSQFDQTHPEQKVKKTTFHKPCVICSDDLRQIWPSVFTVAVCTGSFTKKQMNQCHFQISGLDKTDTYTHLLELNYTSKCSEEQSKQ